MIFTVLALTLFSSAAFGIYAAWKHYATYSFRATPNKDGKDTVLITGASKGIGFQIAKLFARDGFNIITASRHEDDIQEATDQFKQINPKIKVFSIRKDMAEEGSAQYLFDRVTKDELYKDLRVNYLVNNAGLCLRGEFLEIPLDRQQAMVHLLANTYMEMCYLWGNYWKKQFEQDNSKSFKILNVASLAGVVFTPLMTSYCAAKRFAHALSICLSEELSKYNISVTSLNPGFTMTPAIPKAGLEHVASFKFNMYDGADRVGAVAYYALMHNHRTVLVGWIMNFMQLLLAHVPYSFHMKYLELIGAADYEELTPSTLLKKGFVVNRGNEREQVEISQQ